MSLKIKDLRLKDYLLVSYKESKGKCLTQVITITSSQTQVALKIIRDNLNSNLEGTVHYLRARDFKVMNVAKVDNLEVVKTLYF
jgi:hypothetical protein